MNTRRDKNSHLQKSLYVNKEKIYQIKKINRNTFYMIKKLINELKKNLKIIKLIPLFIKMENQPSES